VCVFPLFKERGRLFERRQKKKKKKKETEGDKNQRDSPWPTNQEHKTGTELEHNARNLKSHKITLGCLAQEVKHAVLVLCCVALTPPKDTHSTFHKHSPYTLIAPIPIPIPLNFIAHIPKHPPPFISSVRENDLQYSLRLC